MTFSVEKKSTLSSVFSTYGNLFICLVRALKQHLLSKRQEEEARLNAESDRILEALKESALKERDKQLHELRSESLRCMGAVTACSYFQNGKTQIRL